MHLQIVRIEPNRISIYTLVFLAQAQLEWRETQKQAIALFKSFYPLKRTGILIVHGVDHKTQTFTPIVK